MSGRKMAPKGSMTRGSNSGPAVMMMPPHIRATFMPNPPLKRFPPIRTHRKNPISGISTYLQHFEASAPKERKVMPTPKELKEARRKERDEVHLSQLKPLIDEYRKDQQEYGGEYRGMNCYNTLFIGRLAYEVTERKLLREMEAFGPVKDLKLVFDREGKSKGYGFVEFENEEDMKRAYRAADGMRIEGRDVVVDVERGHTVPSWLPRRLGGGLGGTRLGGKEKNVNRPGRFDPSRVETVRPLDSMMIDGPPGSMIRGQGNLAYGAEYDNRQSQHGTHIAGTHSRSMERPAYDDGRRRRRSRSRSPDRRYAPRPRY